MLSAIGTSTTFILLQQYNVQTFEQFSGVCATLPFSNCCAICYRYMYTSMYLSMYLESLGRPDVEDSRAQECWGGRDRLACPASS